MWPLSAQRVKVPRQFDQRESLCKGERSSERCDIPGQVGQALHLQQPRLVQGAGIDVDAVAVGGRAVGEGFVVLRRRRDNGNYNMVKEAVPPSILFEVTQRSLLYPVRVTLSRYGRSKLRVFFYLGRLLQVASVVLLDVVPGADGGLELVAHHHAGTLSGGPSDEEHDTGPCVGESPLENRKKEELSASQQDQVFVQRSLTKL